MVPINPQDAYNLKRQFTAAQAASTRELRCIIEMNGAQWRVERHRDAPEPLRQVVKVLTMIRSLEPTCILSLLPNELLFLLFENLYDAAAFYHEPPPRYPPSSSIVESTTTTTTTSTSSTATRQHTQRPNQPIRKCIIM